MESKSYHFTGTGAEILGLFKNEPYVFLLESSLPDRRQGRYSFIGFDPVETFTSRGGDRLDEVKEIYGRYASVPAHPDTPFPCGMFGYLSYDFGLHFENIQRLPKKHDALPECFFGFYDCVLTVDHLTRKIHIVSSGRRKRLASVQKILEPFLSLRSNPDVGDCFGTNVPRNDCNLTSNFTKPGYRQAVRRALDYIKRGDIYQVNLSQRFSLDAQHRLEPYAVYRQLRDLSPTHFGGYFDCGKFQIVSSSPERFLSLRGDQVETRPMKGTRPRGTTPIQDTANRKELWKSVKDQAELLMITDLERNDLGRVCDYGSVKVRQMRAMEEYKTVFQATSTITGRLRRDKSPFDLLRACFPGGSITGCPKIRAMDIIEELEPSRRGIYTGSMGYISFSGAMDFNILIRTLLVNGRKVSFHVGGGIVADSVPQKEYEETLVKAKAMEECLKAVLAGNDKGETIFLDGQFVPADKTLLKSLTPGVVKGSGVFETMRAENGRVLLLDRHLDRLEAGLKKLRVRCPYSRAALFAVIQKLVAGKMARVRLMVWKEKGRVRTAVVAVPYKPFSVSKYKQGFRATLSGLRCDERSPLANIKAVRYQPFYAAFQRAKAKDIDEAVLLNRKGEVVEGSRSNIFVVKEGKLSTPALACGCLNGITRRAVMDLARKAGVQVKEGVLHPDDLANAQEVFLTNSLWDIMPLTVWNGQRIGSGKSGRVTVELMKKYKQHLLSKGFSL